MSKPKPVKPFFKINFEDLEIAESFFENEKHFSEFLLAVSYYYRGKDYTIKQKFVQRYFNTYKKTMDFIIESKKTGSYGGKQRVENQKIKEQTLEGVVEAPVEPNNKLLNSNKKEESINNITSGKPEKLDFDLLLQYLNKKTDRSFRAINETVKRKYNSTLKQGYTKDDIRTAIDNAVKAKNHIENNFQYLTLEFFSRPDKLDMYSAKKESKGIEGETEEEKDLRIRRESFKNIKVH